MRKNDADLLTIKFAPKRRQDLAMHNKKLEELANWLSVAFPEKGQLPSTLFLTGPTGSGKSTSVEIMCFEQDIEVVDYCPEVLHDDNLECESADSSQLIRFLVRRHASLGKQSKKKLLLVSELPDQAYHDVPKFRDDLSEALLNIWHPVIFCLSNEIASWHLNPSRIFSDLFLQQTKMSTLTFNPVADTFVKKALTRAADFLQTPLSMAKLTMISDEAKGDLRAAMNMLQMNTVGRHPNRESGSKFVCQTKANREETFHMIGRVLWAKRMNPNVPKRGRLSEKRRKSIPMPTERTPLEHEPTDIIAMSSMSSDKLTNFLFENEISFCTDLSKYRNVTETISLCDAMTGDWQTRRMLPDEYVAQIAVRNVMWNNFNSGKMFKGLFHVRRPTLHDLDREIQSTSDALRKVPTVGIRYFSALSAPYMTIIDEIIDPHRVEAFVSRPFSISWKSGRDQIEDQMEKQEKMRKRKWPVKKSGKFEKSKKKEEEEEEEEEKWTIEDSSDDSFEEF